MAGKFTNNASSTLAGSISAAATSISVASGEGALFPILGVGDWCRLTLTKLVGGLPVREIIKATARSVDVMTIVRAQEGTTALTFTAGDVVDLRITAGVLGDLAPLVSPALTGTPSAPTAAEGDGSDTLANTEYADRAAQSAVDQVAGATAVLASAATVGIGAAGAGNITISGATTITAFDVIDEGTLRRVIFIAALTLTHHVTALQLPGSANILTTPGDAALFKSLGGGNWKCISYMRASSTGAVAASATKDGYLVSADWIAFNGKQAALGFTPYDAANPAGYLPAATAASTYMPKGGGTFTSSVIFNNNHGLYAKDFSGTSYALLYVGADNKTYFGLAGGEDLVFRTRAGTTLATLTNAGGFTAESVTAGTITQTSDQRKKHNWNPLTDAQLDALADMRLAGTFEWIDGGGPSVGGSAQEIQSIVPEAIITDENDELSVNYGGLNFAILQAMLRRQKAAA